MKTESSYRYLPLLENVKYDLLKRQKETGIYDKDGYVFRWEDGRTYDPDYMTKLFKKAVRAGIDGQESNGNGYCGAS